MVYGFDPRVRYLSGPLGAPARRRLLRKYGLRGLGDDIATTDSPLPDTLTPPSDLPPIVNPTPWQIIGSSPIATSSSPLPSTLTPTPSPAIVINPYPTIAAGNAAMPAGSVPSTSIFTGQAIPGISNSILFLGVGGVVALMLLSGGKKKR